MQLFNILNHTKAELIDHLGSDLTVVNAARVSFESESVWYDQQAEILELSDQKLIEFLARNNHWSPFAHPQLQFRYTLPIFIARQEFKHIVGFVRNEVSGRYVSRGNENLQFYLPDDFHLAPANRKQGSSDEIITHYTPVKYMELSGDTPRNIHDDALDLYEHAATFYTDLIANNVAPEEARMFLPQSMFTSYYITGSLAAFARFYNLRADSHAQRLIQEHAKLVGPQIETLFPYSWRNLVGVSNIGVGNVEGQTGLHLTVSSSRPGIGETVSANSN